ncbi:MAG: HAD family hydrolase [Victivallaceae bacterium]
MPEINIKINRFDRKSTNFEMNDYSTIKNVFFDIDNTITESILGYSTVGYFEYVMAGMLCRLKNMSFATALEKVLETEAEYPFHDPFSASEALTIPVDSYQNELAAFQDKYLRVFEDAVELVKTLKKAGVSLFVTSNNSYRRAYAALHGAGLSGWNDSEYFTGVFSPENTGFNKSDIRFYKQVITSGAFDPREMLVIGDNMTDDYRTPLAAGIKHAVIIDRRYPNKPETAHSVNDLRHLAKKFHNPVKKNEKQSLFCEEATFAE